MGIFSKWMMDKVLEPMADRMLAEQEKTHPGRYNPETGAMASFDWCRFRQDRRCMYPKELHAEGTAALGYAVWVPIDRGFCPRDPWAEQKKCPVGEPGPNSRQADALPDATIRYEDGGQRAY